VRIRHSRGSYEVEIESLSYVLQSHPNALIVTDENVARFWLESSPFPILAVSVGETSKSMETYWQVLQFLAARGATRTSTVIALGGGVVGDLAGFAAATYMRGVPLVQVPTSLLAMVDSSVGGKTGINLPEGKNLVGAFYPPGHVSICLETLETLPAREFLAGTAEIWKAAAILDWALFEELERLPLVRGDTRLPQVVMRSIDLKRSIVEEDEFESTGARAVLNFGHTVGHAIEHASGYGTYSHGEAVAIGMVVEASIGERLGLTPEGLSRRISSGLRAQGLPVSVPSVGVEGLLGAMHRDKKAATQGLALALITGYGSCKLVHGVPEPVILECLQENT
jgi:3-dehydroquinate synthase